MREDNIDNKILDLQNDFFEKCDKITMLLPKQTDYIQNKKNNITEAIKNLLSVNQDLNSILAINEIENLCHQGMNILKYIFENIIDQKNNDQVNRFYELLNELKRIYKLPTKTNDEIQKKYNVINDLINQIEAFQNEISCKTLYKKY